MMARLLTEWPCPDDDQYSAKRWPVEPVYAHWAADFANPWRHLTTALPMSVMAAWSAFCQTWFGIGCFMLFGDAIWEGERIKK